ncbi:MAG: hypothetical protein EBR82_14475 [Caulobacteraceae bacterium]|nr:hypothetical protein [Caulobacteraceae bacterium]
MTKTDYTCWGQSELINEISKLKSQIDKNHVDRADVCELAHELTVKECLRQGIELEKVEKNLDVRYTESAQDIFNDYLNLIESTLNI